MKKGLFGCFLGGVILGASLLVCSAAEKSNQIIMTIDDVNAEVFGETIANDVAPIIRNNRTMTASRFVAEKLGAEVFWDKDSKQVLIVKGTTTIILTINSNEALVNGNVVTLDVPAFIENNRTYTPARFVAENLGASVEWLKDTRQVVVTVSEEDDGQTEEENNEQTAEGDKEQTPPEKEEQKTEENKEQNPEQNSEQVTEETPENKEPDFETVTFGKYEQDGSSKNGREPIEWYVLEHKSDGTAFLISKYILLNRDYHGKNLSISWAGSNLKYWLDNYFYETAFDEEERKLIKESTHTGIRTKVGLLDYSSANKYFKTNEERIASMTKAANKSKSEDNTNAWWLSTSNGLTASSVQKNGVNDRNGIVVNDYNVGVRPVILVALPEENQ